MAMPQQDNYFEQIRRHEGLMAYEGREEVRREEVRSGGVGS